MTRDVTSVIASSVSKTAKPVKVIDDEGRVRCASGTYGIRREETWEDSHGKVVHYNLAFIHHGVCSVDNGRVLGYDNAHGVPERHWMGEVVPALSEEYDVIYQRFQRELDQLRRTI